MDRRDEGSGAVEMVGLLPVALLGFCIILQVMFSLTASQSAHHAAREGAREYSQTNSVSSGAAVARASVPRGVAVESVTPVGPGHGMRVQVKAPLAHRWLISPTITHEVIMP